MNHLSAEESGLSQPRRSAHSLGNGRSRTEGTRNVFEAVLDRHLADLQRVASLLCGADGGRRLILSTVQSLYRRWRQRPGNPPGRIEILAAFADRYRNRPKGSCQDERHRPKDATELSLGSVRMPDLLVGLNTEERLAAVFTLSLGLSRDDLMAVLALDPQRVRSLVHRARLQLSRMLAPALSNGSDGYPGEYTGNIA